METRTVSIDATMDWDGEDDTLTVAIIAPDDWDTLDVIEAMLILVQSMQDAELELTAANDTAH
jgi:hypothetical protein